MAIEAGAQFGPYRIVEKIGAGGMGEVYRAQDTRLDRTVAVKVLLASIAADPERLRRFEQEARTLAALNHPNILAVHDLGTHNGTPYLVSEFLEGETLRDKLEAGPVPVRKATEYALGIANGLAAGHSKGIVHRDIKPENIFLTTDGRIKILDFGLAKLVQPTGEDANVTMLTSNATQPGMVLGTVGYMSPEQVRGEPAEATSDIFSFGSVLYEMLSGKRAFKRDTAAETMTAVLREDPPELMSETGSGRHPIPAGLERILQRCLEKNPRQRFQSASDLAFAIESLSGSGASSSGILGSSMSQTALPAIASPRRNPWRYAWLAVPVLVIAGGWWLTHREPAAGVPTFQRVTYQAGYIPQARFLHGSSTILYSELIDDGKTHTYQITANLRQPTEVNVPEGIAMAVSTADTMLLATDPAYLSNFQEGTLSDVPVTGGTPRPLQRSVLSADYAPDGTTIALVRANGSGKCLLEYPAGKVLAQTNGYFDHIRVSPDGQHVALDEHTVYGDDRGYLTVVDRAGKLQRLTPEYETIQGLAWKNNAEVWYTAALGSGQADQLFAVTLSGKIRSLLTSASRMRLQDIAPDGRLLLDTPDDKLTITAKDPTGKVHPHLEMYDESVLTQITPDGSGLVMFETNAGADGLYQVIYRKTDGSPPLVLGSGSGAQLSPDGKTVVAELLTNPPKVALYPLGVGESRMLPVGDLTQLQHVSWFPDGKRLLVEGAEPGKALCWWALDSDSGALVPWGPESFRFFSGWSPDGTQAAGRVGTGWVTYDVASKQTRPIAGIGEKEWIAGWASDGQALIVETIETAGSTAWRQDLKTGKRTELLRVDSPDKAGAQASYLLLAADEKSYALLQNTTHSTLWVVDGVN
jgi:serine/threonine protein kinase